MSHPPPCSQSCNNTIGSFSCGCRLGYELTNDGKTCEGILLLVTDGLGQFKQILLLAFLCLLDTVDKFCSFSLGFRLGGNSCDAESLTFV